jgi:sorbitol-specific phosphotransferase system component IIBC
VPPLAAAYHWIELPVACRFATVGLLLAQKDCDALPVGAAGVLFTVAVTSNREVLSHPETVCEA